MGVILQNTTNLYIVMANCPTSAGPAVRVATEEFSDLTNY